MACHSDASEARILMQVAWPVSHTPLAFNAPAEGFPWADLREIWHGPPHMPIVQNRVKYCRKV